jgi:hypothetical protein
MYTLSYLNRLRSLQICNQEVSRLAEVGLGMRKV